MKNWWERSQKANDARSGRRPSRSASESWTPALACGLRAAHAAGARRARTATDKPDSTKRAEDRALPRAKFLIPASGDAVPANALRGLLDRLVGLFVAAGRDERGTDPLRDRLLGDHALRHVAAGRQLEHD